VYFANEQHNCHTSPDIIAQWLVFGDHGTESGAGIAEHR
jgi:hypothetical protein